jgi:hypothetical protein
MLTDALRSTSPVHAPKNRRPKKMTPTLRILAVTCDATVERPVCTTVHFTASENNITCHAVQNG